MIASSSVRPRSIRLTQRRGLGLLEVIICTALVAVMVVPIAGVIRASAKVIERSNGSMAPDAKLRREMRWLMGTIRQSEIRSVNKQQLRLRLESGEDARIRLRGRTLVLETNDGRTVIATSIRRVEFSEFQSASAGKRVGLSVLLNAVDPRTGGTTTLDALIAIRPQT